jgi:hypothetical protein
MVDFERKFPRTIRTLRQVEEDCSLNVAERRITLSDGKTGIMRLSDSGRCLEFLGDDGGYWSSLVDDSKDFFHPKVTERVGLQTGTSQTLVFQERDVALNNSFAGSPPEAEEIYNHYLQHGDALYRELGVVID